PGRSERRGQPSGLHPLRLSRAGRRALAHQARRLRRLGRSRRRARGACHWPGESSCARLRDGRDCEAQGVVSAQGRAPRGMRLAELRVGEHRLMKSLIVSGALAALFLVPSTASAEWILTPFIGASFPVGSDVNDVEFDTLLDGSKMTYGGTLTWLGGGVLGFEADFGYSPEFFEADDDDLDFIDSSNYSSLMANVVLSAPYGAFRPYATAGVGIINTSIDDVDDIFDVDRNALGF